MPFALNNMSSYLFFQVRQRQFRIDQAVQNQFDQRFPTVMNNDAIFILNIIHVFD